MTIYRVTATIKVDSEIEANSEEEAKARASDLLTDQLLLFSPDGKPNPFEVQSSDDDFKIEAAG